MFGLSKLTACEKNLGTQLRCAARRDGPDIALFVFSYENKFSENAVPTYYKYDTRSAGTGGTRGPLPAFSGNNQHLLRPLG